MSINKDSQKAPNIRFKGFTDDWEQRKLKSIGKTFTGLSGKTKDDFGHGEANYIPYTNIFNNPITDVDQLESIEIDMKQNSVVYGDILFTTSSETPEEVGMSSVWMYEKENVYLNSFCFGFRPIEKHYPLYLAYLLRSPDMRKKFTILAQGISRYNISKNKVLELTIPLPAISEQIKIGNTLKYLDNTITLHQRKLDQLNQLKEALLQKMFPDKGETVPKLRFAGFEGDWEERKLSSMTMYKNGKSHEEKQSTSGKYELINLNSISISGGLKHSGKFIEETNDTLQKDDLVMILSDVGHGDLLGRVALIPNDNMFVLNQRVALLRPNETADPHFLFSYINAHQHYFKSQGAGMSQLNISKGSVENFTSNVPTIQEQNHIGTFFKSLDNTIVLYQGKLEQLQNMKQVLLENMFI